MKILELRAENIKNLKVVEIKPGSNAVVLTGKNAAGKSAVLDAILMALTGKKIEKPIRNGKDRAEVNIDLGDYHVRKVFTEGGERLEVKSKDGQKYGSPQSLLNDILGKLSFDPLGFSKMSESEQRELLINLVGLDFSETEEKRSQLYVDRTARNREAKILEANLVTAVKPDVDAVFEEISFVDELKKIEALEQKKDKYDSFIESIDDVRSEIDTNNSRLEEIDIELKKLDQEKLKLNQENKSLSEQIEKSKSEKPEEVTEETIKVAREELSNIEEQNNIIRQNNRYKALEAKLNEAKAEAKQLDDAIKQIDSDKAQKIQDCQFPLEGLGINDEIVLFNGTPFKQLSTGEQIKISTAIAMKLNPKLRVILIREGSLLDEQGMQSIISAAKDNDYQIWIEKVDSNRNVGLHIENGQIVSGTENNI